MLVLRRVGFQGGGFHFFFQMFTPKIGEDSKCDGYFSDGLKPPTRLDYTPEN